MNSTTHSHSILVAEEELGLRLDQLLSKRYPEHSRTYFQQLIEDNQVQLNGQPVKKQLRPSLGDAIEIFFQEPRLLAVEPEPISLDILFEDEHLIAINKPANMVVHPAPGSYTGTFANALLYHCKELPTEEDAELRPGIIHRLDKDTTGILLGAKTRLAHQNLVKQFTNREIEKKYLAICTSTPPEGKFSAPLKRHPVKRKEMTVCPEGKEAISHFHVLAKNKNLCLVEVQLITGRTHQIRAHLKHLNCPVLGDPVYGSPSLNQKYRVNRQLLHAHKIKFIHPFSKISLELICPVPHDMKNFIEQIKQA